MVHAKSGTFATMVEYRDRLAAAMKAASISASKLAEGLDTSYQAVKKVIDGKSQAFNAANNAQAAKILGVSSDWLALGGPDMHAGVSPTTQSDPWPFPSVPESLVRSLPDDLTKQLEGALLLALGQMGVKAKGPTRASAPAPKSGNLVDMDQAADEFPMRLREPMPWEVDAVRPASKRAPLQISTQPDVHIADAGYSANDHEFMPVPELDVRLAAGRLGIENYEETQIGEILLRKSFLMSFGLPVERMRIVYGDGDSMEPVIRHRAPMLFFEDRITDKAQINPFTIYAVNRAGKMLVKCLARDRAGNWLMRSLNPRYPDAPMNDDEGGDVRIVGRILWSPYDLRNGVDRRLISR
ncbi:S24 family peptidase [Achromobacter xylosoxidans]|uniref:S24 family peptidase n=1 Tax=Alcaligenes xylosoxydans xylosoxydans TaxID=85698 RepID=UPI001F065F59|nr:S24 family peptidase [Achromobacter xylosoxidans]MCH1984831.1 S24 family peptidase [Achromobacter xylosoxidans]MCH1994751.1 S24 family peptidase [Achromobacter xylosoxidans]MCH4589500.1 S24 family peptidase [Achromobacter xylosoxidans]